MMGRGGFDSQAFEIMKKQIFEYIKNNSGRFNGAEIEIDLHCEGMKYLKKYDDGTLVSPLSELASEGKIYYHYGKKKWFIRKLD